MFVIKFGTWKKFNEGIRIYTRMYFLGLWTPFCRLERWNKDDWWWLN